MPICFTGSVTISNAFPSEASTSTSKRSPISIGSSVSFTGSARKPPSLAMTYSGRLSLAARFSERALQPLRKRRRSQPRGARCCGYCAPLVNMRSPNQPTAALITSRRYSICASLPSRLSCRITGISSCPQVFGSGSLALSSSSSSTSPASPIMTWLPVLPCVCGWNQQVAAG